MKAFQRSLKRVVCFALVLCAAGVLLHVGYGAFLKAVYPLRYEEAVMKGAEDYNLDPALIYAVIKAESNFEEEAVSHAGAIGLMQLTPDTFAWLQSKTGGVKYDAEALKEPDINIEYGCYLLSILIEKYDELETALCAYNAGIGKVNSWLNDPEISQDGASLSTIPYKETRKYASVVLKNYIRYSELYQF